MKKQHLVLAVLSMLVGWGTADMAQAKPPSSAPPSSAPAPVVSFYATDNPGAWFECTNTGTSASGIGCVPASIVGPGQKSLAVIRPGESVAFPSLGGRTRTVHTATSLIYPTDDKGAGNPGMPFILDVNLHEPKPIANQTVTLTKPGLYVVTCSIHPYMFGAVIVDDPKTKGPDKGLALDLGEYITIPNGITVPTSHDLATRLLRTFFIATDPSNWQNYASSDPWHITYPPVPVRITGGTVVNLRDALSTLYGNDIPLVPISHPATVGVGQVWVDTQFEKVFEKNKPGTATAVNAETWNVERKVALPEINMNNPHNMWTDRNQNLIYQTQWFDNTLTIFNRADGKLVRNVLVGDAPAHVMTRVDTDEIHVTNNGEKRTDSVMEIDPLGTGEPRRVEIGRGNPHAHWMSFDGKKMVTPNVLTGDSTQVNFGTPNTIDHILQTSPSTLGHPLATGMMPNASKYYVANLLDSTISVIDMNRHAVINTIPLLANYDLVAGKVKKDGNGNDLPYGALPIQTPVSPDGKNMVTANTLTGTITVVDTRNSLADGNTVNPNPNVDKVVAMALDKKAKDEGYKLVNCDPGCHGVQYGAKKDGGYYAYVTSKFSNRMIVVDPDPDGNGNPDDATVVGHILLTQDSGTAKDGTITEYPGMGGQGVLPIPLVYHGWVQNLPNEWKCKLTGQQLNPTGAPVNPPSCP